MDIKEENICRLCLKVTEKDFDIIDETVRNMFEVLSLRVNLDISKDPIVCKDCKETSIESFNFKSVCTVTEERISKIGQDVFMCRFCLNCLDGSNFVLLNTLTNDVTFVEKLQALLPVMDFNVIKNPVICIPCGQDLMRYVKFAETCLDVEGKITNYCRSDNTPSSARIKLSDVLQFMFKNIVKSNNSQIHAIKEEKNTLEEAEIYDSKLIKVEDVMDVKEHGVNFDKIVSETPPDMYEYKLNISRELKCETDMGRAQKVSTPTANSGTCLCATIHHGDKVSNTISGTEMRKTDPAKYKNISGEIIFKCASCAYETNRKNNLESHTLIHKNVTEVEMYKCSICTYEAKRKSNLKNHILTHKDVTEVAMYKCLMCTYMTKRNSDLNRHTLIHQNVTGLELHKCSMCTYESKQKSNLKNHMLMHKDVTEVEIYKCATYTYETIHKYGFKYHMLTHRDVTQVKMYKCTMCSYETKHKNILKRHMLIHKNVREVEMYRCSMCTYETKHKCSLKTHMLIHKGTSEVVMYKCSVCNFQTKRKAHLKRHILTHKQKGNPKPNVKRHI